MLQSQVFQSFARKRSIGAVRLGALGAFIGGAYGFFWHQSQSSLLQRLYDRVENEIQSWNPTSLESMNALIYPWAQNDSINEWEYKLVKLYGYFRDERVFIKREREGKDGYLVIAPFVTASQNKDMNVDVTPMVARSQIMVNLGWVPVENKSDIQMGGDPIGTAEFENISKSELPDRFTGFRQNLAELDDDELQPFTELTGLVRRGEKQNILRGRRNWVDDRVFNFIDLWWMSRFFRSHNLYASSIAYIERVVPELDEDSATNFPIPATKETWTKEPVTPYTHQNLSYMYLISGIVSFGILALRR